MREITLLLAAEENAFVKELATIGGGLDASDDQTLSSSVVADAMREITLLLAAEEDIFVKELAITGGGLDAFDDQTLSSSVAAIGSGSEAIELELSCCISLFEC